MQSQFCEWCGAPAVDSSELCKNCLDAQSAAESQNNQTALRPVVQPPNAPRTMMQTAGSILLQITRGIGIVVIGFLMVATMLFGTCSAIIAGVSLSTPGLAAGFAVLAAIGVGLTFLLYKGLTTMFRKPPQEIDRIAKAGTEDV